LARSRLRIGARSRRAEKGQSFRHVGGESLPLRGRDKLNKEINASFADPVMKARFADVGATMPMTVADFEKFVVEET
jgi:hypothetical protein